MAERAPRGIVLLTPDGYYTREQAAQQIGRSRDTLRRWQKMGRFVPTQYMNVGKLKVWLYSEADIATLKDIAATVREGRPPKTKEAGQ